MGMSVGDSSSSDGTSQRLRPGKESCQSCYFPSSNSCILVLLQQGTGSPMQEAIRMIIYSSEVFCFALVENGPETVTSNSEITG